MLHSVVGRRVAPDPQPTLYLSVVYIVYKQSTMYASGSTPGLARDRKPSRCCCCAWPPPQNFLGRVTSQAQATASLNRQLTRGKSRPQSSQAGRPPSLPWGVQWRETHWHASPLTSLLVSQKEPSRPSQVVVSQQHARAEGDMDTGARHWAGRVVQGPKTDKNSNRVE